MEQSTRITPSARELDPLEQLIGAARRRGRGALTNETGRFETLRREEFDDGWSGLEDLPACKTFVTIETARSALTRNHSPDIPFDRSVNAYRGCEHGCVYCYARPTHCFMGLSAGLDFETRLFAKTNIVERLEQQLAKPGYDVQPIALGTNTDPYQPVEKTYKLTRAILELLARTSHPVMITTKSANILRDLDILSSMARKDLVQVALSVTTLDRKLARTMEPRATTPAKRLEALGALSRAGIPTSVIMGPIIPALNDIEIEDILAAARIAGCRSASYIMLRLPLEVRDLFKQWLHEHYPDRARRIMSQIRAMRGGEENSSKWHERRRGNGVYADMIARRFELALKRNGLGQPRDTSRVDLFQPPLLQDQQLRLL